MASGESTQGGSGRLGGVTDWRRTSSITELAADLVDHRSVVGLTVSTPPITTRVVGLVMLVMPCLLPLDRSGEARRGRVGGQDSDVRLVRRLL